MVDPDRRLRGDFHVAARGRRGRRQLIAAAEYARSSARAGRVLRLVPATWAPPGRRLPPVGGVAPVKGCCGGARPRSYSACERSSQRERGGIVGAQVVDPDRRLRGDLHVAARGGRGRRQLIAAAEYARSSAGAGRLLRLIPATAQHRQAGVARIGRVLPRAGTQREGGAARGAHLALVPAARAQARGRRGPAHSIGRAGPAGSVAPRARAARMLLKQDGLEPLNRDGLIPPGRDGRMPLSLTMQL